MKKQSIIRTLLAGGMILLITTFNMSAQTAVGLRLGGTSGVSIKTGFYNDHHLEAIIGASPSGLSLTGLYEISKPAFSSSNPNQVSGLSWYYGVGGHLSFRRDGYRYYYYGDRYYYYTDRAAVGIGIDGVLGLEYKIPEIPFAISLDLKPYVEVGTDGLIYLSPDPGLGLKFVF